MAHLGPEASFCSCLLSVGEADMRAMVRCHACWLKPGGTGSGRGVVKQELFRAMLELPSRDLPQNQEYRDRQ
jgi:hypothetical protein